MKTKILQYSLVSTIAVAIVCLSLSPHVFKMPYLLFESVISMGKTKFDPGLLMRFRDDWQKNNWAMVLGGNRVYDFTPKKRRLILSSVDGSHHGYTWHGAGLSHEGKWLGVIGNSDYPFPFQRNFFLLDWVTYNSAKGLLQDKLVKPFPDYEVTSFTWSPKEAKLAFTGRKRNGKYKNDWEDKKTPFGVFIYDVENEKIENLPIVGRISFTRNSWSVNDKLVFQKAKENDLFLYDIKTQAITPLFKGYSASWTPDGKLCYHEPKENYLNESFYLYDVVTREKIKLLTNKDHRGSYGSISGPLVWSPDGRYVMFGVLAGFKLTEDLPHILELSTGRMTAISDAITYMFSADPTWVVQQYKKAM